MEQAVPVLNEVTAGLEGTPHFPQAEAQSSGGLSPCTHLLELLSQVLPFSLALFPFVTPIPRSPLFPPRPHGHGKCSEPEGNVPATWGLPSHVVWVRSYFYLCPSFFSTHQIKPAHLMIAFYLESSDSLLLIRNGSLGWHVG